jgi:hypothetical protein
LTWSTWSVTEPRTDADAVVAVAYTSSMTSHPRTGVGVVHACRLVGHPSTPSSMGAMIRTRRLWSVTVVL